MTEITDILKFYKEIGADFVERRNPEPASELRELTRRILTCTKCPLHKTKTNYVPGEGNISPEIIFVGEGPGETEDKFGRPFIGKAGQLLEKIIEKMGYSRETVFIGNIVKCRPPNNRDPQKDEVEACIPYLEDQIKILEPKAIVCLGKVALNNLLNTNYPISKVRGQLFNFMDIPVIPTYHPAFILHKKGREEVSRVKWEMWRDMEKVMAIVKGDEVVES
ncbi:MAG: uracil-DNA glycosylase [Candidatus Aminicenantes bacterium]|nr:uracil-DNA glycosylase [Candidatus Aminicenantes bacterium]